MTLYQFIMIFVCEALFGIACYAFGKSRAELIPYDEDEADELEAALYEAYNIGLHDGMGYPDVSIQNHVNNYLSKIDIRKDI